MSRPSLTQSSCLCPEARGAHGYVFMLTAETAREHFTSFKITVNWHWRILKLWNPFKIKHLVQGQKKLFLCSLTEKKNHTLHYHPFHLSIFVALSFKGTFLTFFCIHTNSLIINACGPHLSLAALSVNMYLSSGLMWAAVSLEGSTLHLHGFIRSNLLPSSSLSHHWSHWSHRAAWWGQRR